MPRASIAALIAAVTLVGCATMGGRPSDTRIVVLPSKQLRVSSVTAEDRAASIAIRGRVARRSMTRAPVWGHLHVEAWGPQGLVAWKDARWSPLSKRRLPASSFGTTLQVAPAEVVEIRISHVTARHRQRAQQEALHD